jgi:predicted alpha/beta-hydrolase family hydrolase
MAAAELPYRLVLAHGAGAPSRSEFMQVFAKGLTARGLPTTLFDFTYMQKGRRIPDRMPQLMDRMKSVAQDAAHELGAPTRVLLGGKSMGGRVATHLAAEGYPCAGLVVLGYPLHPAGKPQERREQHLSKVHVPALFIAGTRDTLAEQALLEKAVQALAGPTTLHWIEGGDHSFAPAARSGRTTRETWDEAMDAVIAFVRGLPRPTRTSSRTPRAPKRKS